MTACPSRQTTASAAGVCLIIIATIIMMMDRPSFAPAPRNLKSSMPNSGNDGQKGAAAAAAAAAAAVRDDAGGSAAPPSLLALLERGRASGPMAEALESLRSALLCPLCLGVFRSPATSGCGHSFCQPCIDRHSADHSLCPVEGCGMPLSMTGRGKSYRQHNPQLDEVAGSYRSLVAALASSPAATAWAENGGGANWWEAPVPEDSVAVREDGDDGDENEAPQQGEDEEEIDLSKVPLSTGRPSCGGSSSGHGDDDESGAGGEPSPRRRRF